MKVQLKHFISRLRFNIDKFNDMCSVKRARPLVNILKSVVILCGLRVTSGKIKTILYLCSRLNRLYRSQGPKGTALQLKAASVVLQQYLGGHHIVDVGLIAGPRVSRNRAGIPRWLRPIDRVSLRNMDADIARFYLTFLNLYRNVVYLGTPGLQTITQPDFGTHSLDQMIYPMIPKFLQLFIFDRFARRRFLSLMREKAGRMNPIFRSSPGSFLLRKGDAEAEVYNFSSHPVVLVRQAISIASQPALAHSLMAILGFTTAKPIKDLFLLILHSGLGLIMKPMTALGKLGAKVEPAGKVRIFAMVDAWTQWALAPIHIAIFEALRGVPQDGTFDQLAPLSRADSFPGLYSLDLSAATDRLPVALQVEILGELLGDREVAKHWANLLVSRDYRFSVMGFEKYHGLYRYAVGQPMGALSSWAMLALTHHFMVQASAWIAGYPRHILYRNYAVLGDDLVLGDANVKDAYLALCESLGIKIGLHKSLLSPSGSALEFAKRTVWHGVDVSPIPIKEFHAACQTLPSLVSFTVKYRLDLVKTLRVFGFGWKVLTWLNKPLGKLSASIRLIILGLSLPNDATSAEAFFQMGEPRLVRHKVVLSQVIEKFNQVELSKLRESIQAYLDWLARVNSASWSGHSAEILRRLVKSQLGDFRHESQASQLERINRFQVFDWYVIWGLLLKVIDAV